MLTDKGEIGIDIKKIQSIEVTEFKSQMTLKEWRVISESKNQTRTFFNYWTQKEAIIKAYGEGLSIPLKSSEMLNNKAVIDDEIFFKRNILIR